MSPRPRRHATAIAALVYSHWGGDLRDLADAAGIHPATLHRILSGGSRPTVRTITALALAMRVTTKKVLDACTISLDHAPNT